MIENTEKTVNISRLTQEQLNAVLSGQLTFDEAYTLAPGPPLTIIEYDIDSLSFDEKPAENNENE
jgi:hypothetical protein